VQYLSDEAAVSNAARGGRRHSVGDQPRHQATFLAESGDDETAARLRQEAVAVVRTFLAAMS
jgi:hypothetical protein